MNGNAVRVLLIEDNPGDARLIQEMLREAGGRAFEVQYAGHLSAGLEALTQDSIDVVLLDLGLPDAQGLEGLGAMQRQPAHVPVVVLTGLDDEEMAAKAVHEGAQDYLVKGQIDSNQLGRAIRYAIGRKQIDEALREVLQELEGRNQELESFTYSVSHDLKEPLRTLEAFSQFLLEDYAGRLDEQGKDYLTRMGKAAGRMKQMIEELLALSRLGRRPEELIKVDPGQVVADIGVALHAGLDEKNASIEVGGGAALRAGGHKPRGADLRQPDRQRPQVQPQRAAGGDHRRAGCTKWRGDVLRARQRHRHRPAVPRQDLRGVPAPPQAGGV